MTNDEVTELCNDLMRRADGCALLAESYGAAREALGGGESVNAARCGGKAAAYRHAAELLRAAAKGGAA